ncbi:MAG: GatB/YqeY domain-containing protein [Candidatus Omnitrophota bacterium]
MSLNAKIEQDLKAAMTARDEARLSTLRFLKSALKYVAIEKKVQQLPDTDILQIIQRQIKQRRESIDQFSKGGRADLADKETKELGILESYLPKQVADKELEGIVAATVKEAGASSKKDFGRVMKLLQEKLAGRAEAKKISEILGRILT